MNDAILYAKSNTYQKTSSKKVIDQFAPLLHWRRDGHDTVLDIGCGNGDVTIELLLPILPSQFRALIACDISEKMIKYAQHTYHHHHPKVEFETLDITGDVDDFLRKHGPFDHIVSFFCLHWIKNQLKTFSNIRKLLASNGECLLMFVTSTNIFAVYDEMSKSEKWSKYMRDADLYVPIHQYAGNPVEDFQKLCQSVGFTSTNIQFHESTYYFEDYEEHKSINFWIY